MKTGFMSIKKSWKSVVTIMVLNLLVPLMGIAQSPPPPGPGGGNPDDPLAVPFDQNLTLAFLAVSIVFAVVKYKQIKKNAAALVLAGSNEKGRA